MAEQPTAGTTGPDTIWYGSDTGRFADTGSVSRDARSPTVVVKGFVAAPSVFWKGEPLSEADQAGLLVGDSIVVVAPDSAHLGISLDGSAPACATTDSGRRVLVAQAVGEFRLAAVACDEDRWTGRVAKARWNVGVRDSLAVAGSFDTIDGTWRDWLAPAHLAASVGTPGKASSRACKRPTSVLGKDRSCNCAPCRVHGNRPVSMTPSSISRRTISSM